MIPRELPPFNAEQRRSREIADEICDKFDRIYFEVASKALDTVIKDKRKRDGSAKRS